MHLLIYHVIAMIVPATNMPLKCHMYATDPNYFMSINEGNMLIYMPYMNSLLSTIPQVALYTVDNDANKTIMMMQSNALAEMVIGQFNQKLLPVWQSTDKNIQMDSNFLFYCS